MGDDVGVTATKSSGAAATLRNVDPYVNEAAASLIDPYSTTMLDKETYNMLNDEQRSYFDTVRLTKRRKPPEYVGYAVNVDSAIDTQGQSTKSQEFLANNSKISSKIGERTNIVQSPVSEELDGYQLSTNEERVWTAACRELNCVRGGTCVPDTLRGGRPRCQCPLGTDGHRCDRRTLTYAYCRQDQLR